MLKARLDTTQEIIDVIFNVLFVIFILLLLAKKFVSHLIPLYINSDYFFLSLVIIGLVSILIALVKRRF